MSSTTKYDFVTVSPSTWNANNTANLGEADEQLYTRRLVMLGMSVAAYQPLYLGDDGKARLARADGKRRPCLGLSLEAGDADDEIKVQREGTITNAAWSWIPGRPVYLSDKAIGGLTQNPPLKDRQMLGVAGALYTQIFLEGNILLDAVQTTTTTSTASTSSSSTTTMTGGSTASSTFSSSSTSSSTSSFSSTSSSSSTVSTVSSASSTSSSSSTASSISTTTSASTSSTSASSTSMTSTTGSSTSSSASSTTGSTSSSSSSNSTTTSSISSTSSSSSTQSTFSSSSSSSSTQTTTSTESSTSTSSSTQSTASTMSTSSSSSTSSSTSSTVPPSWEKGDDFAPHNMTANDAPSPYVASASSSYHAVTQPYKAFDNSDGELGHWLSAASAHPKYLQIDVGEGNEKRLYSYAIHATNWASMDRMPKDWLLQGSNNGDDWDTLDTVSDEIGWGATETREYVCDTAGTTYRYFQIYITANNGDADYTGVGEFYLYEAV